MIRNRWTALAAMFLLCAVAIAGDAVRKSVETAPEATSRLNQADPSPCAHRESVSGGVITVDQSYASKCWEQAIMVVAKEVPEEVDAGTPYEVRIHLKNQSDIDLSGVVVRDKIPGNFALIDTEPKAAEGDGFLTWVLKIKGKEEIILKIRGTSKQEGIVEHMGSVAWAKPLHIATRATMPKLEIVKKGPANVTIGDEFEYEISVRNSGSGTARNVKLSDVLPEGLVMIPSEKKASLFSRRSKSVAMSGAEESLGDLKAGEERSVRVRVSAAKEGVWDNKAAANADKGLKVEATATTTVSVPKLSIVKKGPKVILLGKEAEYVIQVTNPGKIPAKDTVLIDQFDEGVLVSAPGGSGKGNEVGWNLGDVPPGEIVERILVIQATKLGTIKDKATVAAKLVKPLFAEAETQVIGFSGILLEVRDANDPVAVNGFGLYEITVTNQSKVSESGVVISAALTDQLGIVDSGGSSAGKVAGNTVLFGKIDDLAAGQVVSWRIAFKGLKPGDARISVSMTTDRLKVPVIEMEATNIYEDK